MIFAAPPLVMWRVPSGWHFTVQGSSMPRFSDRCWESAAAHGWISPGFSSVVTLTT